MFVQPEINHLNLFSRKLLWLLVIFNDKCLVHICSKVIERVKFDGEVKIGKNKTRQILFRKFTVFTLNINNKESYKIPFIV